MVYQIWRHYKLALPVVLAIVGSAVDASANPAGVFNRQLAQIQSNLPPGIVMRLPSEIRLSGSSDIDERKLFVRVFPSDTPRTFTLSISTCESGPLPCLIGSFAADRNTSASAVRDLHRHQIQGKPVTLAKNVVGYLLEGPLQKPSYRFSTVMWEQEGMIYTISFPAIERQNILFMAYSMAHATPISRVAAPRLIVPSTFDRF